MNSKNKKEYIGVGRRKTAVASIRLKKGEGKIDVNGKKLEEYFPSKLQQKTILAPLEKFSSKDKYDIIIRLKGGGIESQAEAIVLGISRALVEENEELRIPLKNIGYLTRDPRKKERKKYGLAGARKRFQFSKR
jgi:small subunit ribosomal protein S9